MSETRDKRRRTDLDLFVLALIDSGVSTPYELQKAAGLSQGATIPALQRLLDVQLVRQGKPGARGRTDYQATAAGKKLLKEGWLALIEEGPSGDADADLRVALLALSAGGDRRQAADFLRRSADRKMESIGAPETIDDLSALAPLARWYSDLRSSAARTLLTAESSTIRAMADALPWKLSDKPKYSIRAAKKPKGT
jgi:DNA-binding PadR family transcriptional regulator